MYPPLNFRIYLMKKDKEKKKIDLLINNSNVTYSHIFNTPCVYVCQLDL